VARKKIVLVIVEGPSDASALERYFVKYFDSDRIVTKIIHGDITTDKEKEDYALEFSEKYIDTIDDFISFLCNSDFSRCDSYEDSWKFIKDGKHSLERYSNLGLCFLPSN
jgi:hypothetical protein